MYSFKSSEALRKIEIDTIDIYYLAAIERGCLHTVER